MKYGFNLPHRGEMAHPDNLIVIVRRAEELGYHSVHFGDHVLMPTGVASQYPYTEDGVFPAADPGEHLEHLNVLSFIAAQTQRIQLVTGVTIVPYRNPLVAAKSLATLDVLSKGRLVVGVGTGWMREEFEALGTPPFEERGAVTDEYISAFKELWMSDRPRFEGKYCRFSDIAFDPKPVQKPHPPIWVGGESPRALRRTAQLGNGWYPVGSNPRFPLNGPGQLEAALERLTSHVRRAGRDPGEIEVIYVPSIADGFELMEGDGASGSAHAPFRGSAEETAARIREYEEVGVDRIMLDFFHTSSTVEEGLAKMETLATRVWPLV